LERNYPEDPADREYAFVSLSSGMLLNTADIYLPYSTSSSYSMQAARLGWRASALIYRVLIFFPVVVAVACLFTDSQVLMKTKTLHERLFIQAPFRLCGLIFSILLFFFAITVTQNNKAIREIYMGIEMKLGRMRRG
jgi:ABC-type molybdate transport system permease subunit